MSGGERYAAVDIGGTNTVIGVFDQENRLLVVRRFRTIKPRAPLQTSEPIAYFDLLEREIGEALEACGGKGKLAAAGMGVPGKVDPLAGMALGAVNLGWADVPFAERMSQRLGVPVFIDNDVRLYTLGEACSGAARGFANVLCVTLGTGFAAGIIADGRIVRGGGLFAGELGHDRVDGEDAPCACGRRGCLETVASATGIVRLAEAQVRAGCSEGLARIARERRLTAHDVFLACEAGDAAAREVFGHVGTVLGRKLASAVFLLNPDVIVIGGGAARAGRYVLEPMRAVLEEHYAPLQPLPELRLAALDDCAGLYGALHFARYYARWGGEATHRGL
ncbi:glucokinase [Paenibacillus sp. UNCCL117]|uniref:ROK family protein n=1 Tax=unclassified Paenibacillus TaxID=185978 RepID=UPI0008877164|nr:MULTISPECIES: ROK family protein [unclassified Paenibacillus]SDD42057.1 glucokinase [Paenibacillus sp. cl123]SFW47703.1 glucokinase [Paenibacillus sp. UNCCL117]